MHRKLFSFFICFLAFTIVMLSACSHYQPKFKHIRKIEHHHPKKRSKIIQTGMASWYGPGFAGRKTANGERFNPMDMTAAHKTLPFNTMVKVINLDNKKAVIVRINDRGPFIKNRIIDLSKKAAIDIGMIPTGTAKVAIAMVE